MLEKKTIIESPYLAESILDFIYNLKHHSQIHELLLYMEYADDSDSKDILDALMNTWNLFPHNSLGGISPKEMSGGYISTKSIKVQPLSKMRSEDELYFEEFATANTLDWSLLSDIRTCFYTNGGYSAYRVVDLWEV